MRITPQGLVALDQAGYDAALRAAFRADINEDLSFDAGTPQGQLVGIIATLFAQGEAGAQHVANGLDRATAVGYQLDALGSLLHITREVATRSRVVLTFTGTAGSTVSVGDIVEDAAGTQWRLIDRHTIIRGFTTALVRAESADYGAVVADPSTITRLVTLRPGIDAVTNAAAAVPGRLEETDPAYRLRQDDLVERNALGSLASIRSALSRIATRGRVDGNDTAADVQVQGAWISAHGIRVAVHGGTDTEVAAAIRATKSIGASTAGTVLSGTYRFDRATVTPLAASLTLTKDADFPADGEAQIKAALVAHAAEWNIGTKPDILRFVAAALTVTGFAVPTYTLTLEGGTALPAVTPFAALYTLAAEDITLA